MLAALILSSHNSALALSCTSQLSLTSANTLLSVCDLKCTTDANACKTTDDLGWLVRCHVGCGQVWQAGRREWQRLWDKDYDERQAQKDKRRMKAETRKVQSWRRVGKKCEEWATSKSCDFRENCSANGTDTSNALDGGEHGPTTLEDTSTQGKRLQLYCEIGDIKLWGSETTRLTTHVFDVQLREFVNQQEVP